MNLVVDIGNTSTKIAWFDRGEMMDCSRFTSGEPLRTDDLHPDRQPERAIISSVRPEIRVLPDEYERKLKRLVYLDHMTPIPVDIRYKSPETLGHDRIAACAGAFCLFPRQDVLIIDMGTTITVDFLNAAGEYLGGNISPGVQTRFRSLHEFTAKLPLLDKDAGFPQFGTDTRSAITAGVQQGIVHELNGYMDDYSTAYPGCKFILTGGDADFFVPKLKRAIFAFPELMMTGLNFILEFNASGGKT